MEALELDEDAIREGINILEQLDYKTASIAEIEEILSPFFKGYRINAPTFDPGIYLYRSRITRTKPVSLAELSYPPKEYISEHGRANDIHCPMFYGSISKNIPFFELNAEAGDRLVMSVWKTTSKLVLNHVGFTEEVSKMLESNRSLNSIYQFASDTRNFNDLNKFVYNYLGAAFSRRISKLESYLYKLSIAITNKLINGDLLNGVLYPSIAMKGNADNIVLKPSYVDDNMQFVAVEYLEVTDCEGMEYKYSILDSAAETDQTKLKWTGKMLGWTLDSEKSISLSSDGSDYIAKTETGERTDPKPTTVIERNLSNLERQYHDSFSNAAKITENIQIRGATENLNAKATLLLDFEKKIRFLSFYIPGSINPLGVVEGLIQKSEHFLTIDSDTEIEMRDLASGVVVSTNKDLPFNNYIYIFSESYLPLSILKKYPGLNIKIQNQ